MKTNETNLNVMISLETIGEIKRLLSISDGAESVALACHVWNMYCEDQDFSELRSCIINFYTSARLAIGLLDDAVSLQTQGHSGFAPSNRPTLS